MGSFVSWLDHSEEDRRRVQEMLLLFSDKDTVDDLGFGTVRDAISNALFPGTSVLQTRARYFLFIPWIFRDAERKRPDALEATAKNMEYRLIGALKAGGDHSGLIGIDAGYNLRTRPSAMFWGGLGRYGIFLEPSLSIRQYCRHVARKQAAADIENPEPLESLDELIRTPSLARETQRHRQQPEAPREWRRERECRRQPAGNSIRGGAKSKWIPAVSAAHQIAVPGPPSRTQRGHVCGPYPRLLLRPL